MRLLDSSFSDRINKKFVQIDNKEKLIFESDCNVSDLKFTYFLGDECNRCPFGWISHIEGATRKCVFTSKSKVEINKLESFCQGLNATVPLPNTNEENQIYLDAFGTRNVTTSVAIRSCHGIVELLRNGYPFPTENSLNTGCETSSFVQKNRIKRQASSGNKFLDDDHWKQSISVPNLNSWVRYWVSGTRNCTGASNLTARFHFIEY